MGPLVLVDESKDPSFILAGVFVDPSTAGQLRRELVGLLLPGQSRLHMCKEKPGRQKRLTAFVVSADVEVRIYRAAGARPKEARRRCLSALARDAVACAALRLVIEADDSSVHSDRQLLFRLGREMRADLVYEHVAARSEPLLWLPDIAAWTWNRGRHLRTPSWEFIEA